MAAEQARAGTAIVKPQHGLDQGMEPRALTQLAFDMVDIALNGGVQVHRRGAKEARAGW